MNKIKKIILSMLTLFILMGNAYCTAPWPSPKGVEDVVEKYNLSGTDKIVLKGEFPENYSGSIHKAIKFSDIIEEKNNINIFLESFRKCQLYDYFYNATPLGEIIFVKNNAEILEMKWFTFQGTLVFVVGDIYYTTDNDKYDQFSKIFMKNVPQEIREGITNFKYPLMNQ
jgi:hypothetical protein